REGEDVRPRVVGALESLGLPRGTDGVVERVEIGDIHSERRRDLVARAHRDRPDVRVRQGGGERFHPRRRSVVQHATSPSRVETLSPTLPDADVWAVSVGAGYEITPSFGVDVAYFHAFYDTVSTAGQPEAFQGTYDTRANIFSFA